MLYSGVNRGTPYTNLNANLKQLQTPPSTLIFNFPGELVVTYFMAVTAGLDGPLAIRPRAEGYRFSLKTSPLTAEPHLLSRYDRETRDGVIAGRVSVIF